jgi:hypothetical protein
MRLAGVFVYKIHDSARMPCQRTSDNNKLPRKYALPPRSDATNDEIMSVADVAAVLKCKSSFYLQHDSPSVPSALRPPDSGSAFALRVAVQEVIGPCVAGLTGDSQGTMSAPTGTFR